MLITMFMVKKLRKIVFQLFLQHLCVYFHPDQCWVFQPEVRDKYRDISLAINIAGFEAYRCISDVYRGALSDVY